MGLCPETIPKPSGDKSINDGSTAGPQCLGPKPVETLRRFDPTYYWPDLAATEF